MNDKTFKIARLIRLAIFLGILFSFAWMFRWDIGSTATTESYASFTKLDRWTGTAYACVFQPIALDGVIRLSLGVVCVQEQP